MLRTRPCLKYCKGEEEHPPRSLQPVPSSISTFRRGSKRGINLLARLLRACLGYGERPCFWPPPVTSHQGLLSSCYPALWLKWSQNILRETQLQPSHLKTPRPCCRTGMVQVPANVAFRAGAGSCPKIRMFPLNNMMGILGIRVSGARVGVFMYHDVRVCMRSGRCHSNLSWQW